MVLDLDLQFRTTASGDIATLTNEEAVIQALKNWLISTPIDLRSNYGSGGPLVPYVHKPLNDQTEFNLKTTLRSSIKRGFSPTIDITDLKIVKDTENLFLGIQITFYAPTLNLYMSDALITY